jgi:hypothetical protein
MTKDRDEMRLEIHPDPNRLDEEWVKQIRLRTSYGFDRAEARRELAIAKAELEVTEAELKLAIRANPVKFELDGKVTEDAIKSTVPVQQEFQEAKERVRDAQYEVDMLDAALEAIDDRKYALKDLVQLRMSNYFGEPRAPAGAREDMEDVVKSSVRKRGRREEE